VTSALVAPRVATSASALCGDRVAVIAGERSGSDVADVRHRRLDDEDASTTTAVGKGLTADRAIWWRYDVLAPDEAPQAPAPAPPPFTVESVMLVLVGVTTAFVPAAE